MIKRWVNLSCLFACAQVMAIACMRVDDGEETTKRTPSTSSRRTDGNDASGGSSAGDLGTAGAAGAGGAGEPEAIGEMPASSGASGILDTSPRPRPLRCGAWRARLYAETGRTPLALP